MSSSKQKEHFRIGWICALDLEAAAAQSVLDEIYDPDDFDQPPDDDNIYTFGRIKNHDVVLACLPSGEYGVGVAASVARDLKRTFPHIKIGLFVGIGGGIPGGTVPGSSKTRPDVRLGDVVVSNPAHGHGGVVFYDLVKVMPDGRQEVKGHLNQPPRAIRAAVSMLRTRALRKGRASTRASEILDDMIRQNPEMQSSRRLEAEPAVFKGEDGLYSRPERNNPLSPHIHYGLIASGDKVIASAAERERLLSFNPEILCFEMEASGVMNDLGALVIRGICDYADANKNDDWHQVAAANAACYAKELIEVLPRIAETEPTHPSSQEDNGNDRERDWRQGPLRLDFHGNHNWSGNSNFGNIMSGSTVNQNLR